MRADGWLERQDERLREELSDLRNAQPRVAAAGRVFVRHRFWILGALAAIRACFDALDYLNHVDSALFIDAGRTLLSTSWPNTFNDAAVQAGPLQVLLYGIASIVGEFLSISFKFPLAILVEVGFVLGIMAASRELLRATGRRPSSAVETLIGSIAVVGGLSWQTYTSAHPAEGAIALLWIGAASFFIRGRTRGGALILGLAAGFKLWGLLGIPIILLAHDRRQRVLASLITGATCAALYLPFLLFGDFRSFGFEWDVAPDAPLRVFLAPDSPFTWQMRLFQSAFVVTTGAWIATRFRTSAAIGWALPLWLVAARLLIDPLDYHYYWVAAWTICTLAFLTELPPRASWMWLGIGASFYAFMILFDVVYGVVEAYVWVILCIATLVLTYRYLLRSRSGLPLAAQRSDLSEQAVQESS